jgi:dihydroorotase-like cyclic amidohydrolase
MGLLFKNGTIVTASDMIEGDLLVEGEIITLISSCTPCSAAPSTP